MSSVYETEKLYPQIPASAPPDDESYRLKKIDELEKFLRSEVESRDKLTKQKFDHPDMTFSRCTYHSQVKIYSSPFFTKFDHLDMIFSSDNF